MALEIAEIDGRPVRFVGYFPKRTVKRPDGFAPVSIEEIASVSGCISPAPEGWIDHWLHNPLGFFATEELAWQVAGGRGQGFDVYACRILDAAFPPGAPPRELSALEDEIITACALAGDPGPGFERLGWDIAGNWLGWSQSIGFECSPLTCNGLASVIATNRYGLIDRLGDAVPAAIRIGAEQPEPGTYYLLEVWRRGDRASP